MRIGLNVSSELLQYPFNLTVDEILRVLADSEPDFIEVQLATPGLLDRQGNVRRKRSERFFKTVERLGLNLGVVHAPYPRFCPTYLEFLEGEIHKEAITTLKNTIRLAARAGAEIVAVHPSHKIGFHKNEESYKNGVIERIIANLGKVLGYAEKRRFDIKLAVETMSPKKDMVVVGDHPRDILEIVNGLDGRVGVVLDTCHTYKSITDQGVQLEDLRDIAPHVCHVHLSAFSPIVSRCHCPMGYGVGPINEMLSMLDTKSEMTLTCEVSPAMFIYLDPRKPLVTWYREVLEDARRRMELT